MATAHHINAEDLRLVLVARRIPFGRVLWAAMSGTFTGSANECSRWGINATLRSSVRPTARPMCTGRFWFVLDRTARQGAAEVRRTFGRGIRAMRAANIYHVER